MQAVKNRLVCLCDLRLRWRWNQKSKIGHIGLKLDFANKMLEVVNPVPGEHDVLAVHRDSLVAGRHRSRTRVCACSAKQVQGLTCNEGYHQ